MAYRRFRSRRGATKYAAASYSEVYDLHTEVGKTTLLGIHTPITDRWQKYLGGFCQQFKRFRYKGASLSFVPVTTLPADPLQVSYEAGEPTIDPRDLMNPIIHCGMRGQSMGDYLDEIFRTNISNRLTSLDVVNYEPENYGIANELEDCYYTALSAPQFRKSHVQQGFRKNGLHPMVYSISTTRPYNYVQTGDSISSESVNRFSRSTVGLGSKLHSESTDVPFEVDGQSTGSGLTFQFDFGGPGSGLGANEADVGQFFTNRLTRLGWLDTVQRYSNFTTNSGNYTETKLTGLPKVYMYFVMLPPAYKQEMYFRVVIRHFFEFSGFRTLYGPFSARSCMSVPYDGPIENLPAEQTEVASLDVYNGEATLLSDGAA